MGEEITKQDAINYFQKEINKAIDDAEYMTDEKFIIYKIALGGCESCPLYEDRINRIVVCDKVKWQEKYKAESEGKKWQRA